jgi:hypothetical protein
MMLPALRPLLALFCAECDPLLVRGTIFPGWRAVALTAAPAAAEDLAVAICGCP